MSECHAKPCQSEFGGCAWICLIFVVLASYSIGQSLQDLAQRLEKAGVIEPVEPTEPTP